MARQKAAVDAKKRDKELDIKAKAMVDGAGLWITCQLACSKRKLTGTDLDEDMAALFATMAQPKFSWEMDAENPGSPKTTPEKSPSQEERPPQNLTDVFGEMQMIGDDVPFMELVSGKVGSNADLWQNDLQMPGSEDPFFRRTPSEVPDEVGRRFSQHSQQLPVSRIRGRSDNPSGTAPPRATLEASTTPTVFAPASRR